ncbi:hypothetical protein CEXT_259531 [Caerostris extrusa]|uniref:Uncharacterized protein n=1 Tax=Caerostris extrusa TaxID=172846 RepID=A0AAV4WHJ2_CAEEX|nr:hypothetical protein CEXT_259531 [Caerostris extrusa]
MINKKLTSKFQHSWEYRSVAEYTSALFLTPSVSISLCCKHRSEDAEQKRDKTQSKHLFKKTRERLVLESQKRVLKVAEISLRERKKKSQERGTGPSSVEVERKGGSLYRKALDVQSSTHKSTRRLNGFYQEVQIKPIVICLKYPETRKGRGEKCICGNRKQFSFH